MATPPDYSNYATDPVPNPLAFPMYQFKMTITSLGDGNSAHTSVYYNNTATFSQIGWTEDGVPKTLNPGSSLGVVLAPIGIGPPPTTTIPEPASLGVLALGGLALLARRRKSGLNSTSFPF